MIALVEEHLDAIVAVCEQAEIKGLWLFGSAGNGDWHAARSDLDFLLNIGEYDDTAGRRWMKLAVGLERIFGENFDLVSRPAIRREEFRKDVDRTAPTIYVR